MSLNQARAVSAAAGLLAVYAADRRKNRPGQPETGKKPVPEISRPDIPAEIIRSTKLGSASSALSRLTIFAETQPDEDGLVNLFRNIILALARSLISNQRDVTCLCKSLT